MPNTYLNSEVVQVYPSAYRGTNSSNQLYNPESRLPTEFNISKQLASFMSSSGFIVHPAYSTTSYGVNEEIQNLEFNIDGYWFKISSFKISDTGLDSPTNIYAYINLVEKNSNIESGNVDYSGLSLSSFENEDQIDVSNKFTALMFSDTEQPHSILLFTKTTTKYRLAKKSYIKLNSSNISNDINGLNTIDERFDTNELHVTNNAEIGGNTTIGGNANITGDVDAGGDETLTGDLSVGGKTTLHDVDITGDISIQGDTTQNGHINLGHINGGDVLTIDRGNIKCDENEGTQSTLNSSGLTVSGNNKTSEVSPEEISTDNINLNKLNNISLSSIFESDKITVTDAKNAQELYGYTEIRDYSEMEPSTGLYKSVALGLDDYSINKGLYQPCMIKCNGNGISVVESGLYMIEGVFAVPPFSNQSYRFSTLMYFSTESNYNNVAILATYQSRESYTGYTIGQHDQFTVNYYATNTIYLDYSGGKIHFMIRRPNNTADEYSINIRIKRLCNFF